jgi:DNA primase
MSFIEDHNVKQKILKKVVTACQHLLYSSEYARETRQYLNSRISKDQQSYWKFGYFPSDEYLSELLQLVPKESLELLNLYYPKYLSGGSFPHGHFSDHNLVMPFYSEHKDVIAILGRCILTEEIRQESLLNKYKYNNGSKKELFVYGLDKAKESTIKNNYIICVEGQFDCIALHNQGITNSIALGWANISRYQLFQIHRYTNNIFFMFDNDEAGNKAKQSIKKRYKDYANIKIISPPKEYKDIDEFFRLEKDQRYLSSVIDTIKTLGD